MAEANKFLQESFIAYVNKKLVVEPKSEVDLHQSINGHDLNSIFCLKYHRMLNNDNTISYKSRFFLLAKKQPIFLRRGEKITVNLNFDGTIILTARGQRLEYQKIEKRPKKEAMPKSEVKNVIYKKPSRNHPWRQGLGNQRRQSDISK